MKSKTARAYRGGGFTYFFNENLFSLIEMLNDELSALIECMNDSQTMMSSVLISAGDVLSGFQWNCNPALKFEKTFVFATIVYKIRLQQIC